MIFSVGIVVTWSSNPRGGCRKLLVRTENSNRLHTGTAVPLKVMQPFDPYSVQLIDDPYRIYSRLRREDPVHYSPVFDGWVLSRHADIEEALRDHGLYSSASGVELGEPLFGPGDFIVHDPPQHDLLRRQVHRPFQGKRLPDLDEQVRAQCVELLDGLADSKEIDVITAYAEIVPAATICSMLGVESERISWVIGQVHALMNRDPETLDVESPLAARDSLTKYFQERCSVGASNTGESGTLMSVLTKSVERGEIEESDFPGLCLTLLAAGTETTSALIGWSVYHLVCGNLSPTYFRDNMGPRGLNVLDEIARLESPIQWLTRTTRDDVELHNKKIPGGSRVILLYASANRDHDVFGSPNSLIPGRNCSRSLAFGAGVHHCLGRLLSRREAFIALQVFLNKFDVAPELGNVSRFRSTWLRGFGHLTVTVKSRP